MSLAPTAARWTAGDDRCIVRWSTGAVSGLSDGDSVCAAASDVLFDRTA